MMFKKNVSGFLSMNKAKILNHSIVLIDNVYNGVPISGSIDVKSYNNCFSELKPLAIKGALGVEFKQISLPEDINKLYEYGDFVITNQFYPPKFIIEQQFNKSDKMINNAEVVKMTQKIIEFAKLSRCIGKIGINFDCVIDDNLIVKDVVMKEKIAKEFTGISFTLEKKLNDLQKLNLQIAGAKNVETNTNSIFIHANFDNTIATENQINETLERNYISILEPIIASIFQ